MPINNQLVYIDATVENSLPLMQAVSDIIGLPLDEAGVMWLNSGHTLGIFVKVVNNNLNFYLRCCGSEYALSLFKAGGGYLAYNCSKNKTVYAFGSKNAADEDVKLNWAIAKDENGTLQVIDCLTGKQAKVYVPEYPTCISHPLYTADDARIMGLTLAGMPAFRSSRPFSELYQVLSASNTIWTSNGTIIADGTYFKLIVPNSTGNGTGALAFPVSDV